MSRPHSLSVVFDHEGASCPALWAGDVRGDAELDLYQIAYVCGGPKRVVMVALVALLQDGRIKISPALHRVNVVRRAPRDPVESAVLDAVPSAGKFLGPTVQAVASSPAVEEIGRTLRVARLVSPLALERAVAMGPPHGRT